MIITSRCSWIPEALVFIAISALYLMVGRFFFQPNLKELAMVLVVFLSFLASIYWLRQAHQTRKESYLGNIILIWFLITGGFVCFLSNFVPGGFDCPWPISMASIIYGAFLIRRLPKTIVLG
jgi:magnesium-transporting ATPase (P-type)